MPPTLAHIEEDPTPTFLTTVGNSSAAYTYRMAKAAAPKNFPSIRKTVTRASKAERTVHNFQLWMTIMLFTVNANVYQFSFFQLISGF